MASGAGDDLPEGWEQYESNGAAFVLYVNTQTKKGPYPKPKIAGGWTLVGRNPVRTHIPNSPDTTYAVASSTSTMSDSIPIGSLHRTPVSRAHSSSGLPDEIRCSHILVKHNESRRPTSWRSDLIRRSKEEALVIATDFREQIMNKETRFEDIAQLYSDCSSAKRLGDLGRFRKGQMQKAFEMVAFKLKVGQMSRPVETKSGIHLILRTL